MIGMLAPLSTDLPTAGILTYTPLASFVEIQTVAAFPSTHELRDVAGHVVCTYVRLCVSYTMTVERFWIVSTNNGQSLPMHEGTSLSRTQDFTECNSIRYVLSGRVI